MRQSPEIAWTVLTDVACLLVSCVHTGMGIGPLDAMLAWVDGWLFSRAQVRIEGMLMAGPPLLLCFQIAQLLAFYARTVGRLAGAGNASRLADTLAGCAALARRVFAEQLKARGDRLLRYPPRAAGGPLAAAPGGLEKDVCLSWLKVWAAAVPPYLRNATHGCDDWAGVHASACLPPACAATGEAMIILR